MVLYQGAFFAAETDVRGCDKCMEINSAIEVDLLEPVKVDELRRNANLLNRWGLV